MISIRHLLFISALGANFRFISASFVSSKLRRGFSRHEAEAANPAQHPSTGIQLAHGTLGEDPFASFWGRGTLPEDTSPIPLRFQDLDAFHETADNNLHSFDELQLLVEQLGPGLSGGGENDTSMLERNLGPLELSPVDEISRYYEKLEPSDHASTSSFTVLRNIAQVPQRPDMFQGRANPADHCIQNPTSKRTLRRMHTLDDEGRVSVLKKVRYEDNTQFQSHFDRGEKSPEHTSSTSALKRNASSALTHAATSLNAPLAPCSYADHLEAFRSQMFLSAPRGAEDSCQGGDPSSSSQGVRPNENKLEYDGQNAINYSHLELLFPVMSPHTIDCHSTTTEPLIQLKWNKIHEAQEIELFGNLSEMEFSSFMQEPPQTKRPVQKHNDFEGGWMKRNKNSDKNLHGTDHPVSNDSFKTESAGNRSMIFYPKRIDPVALAWIASIPVKLMLPESEKRNASVREFIYVIEKHYDYKLKIFYPQNGPLNEVAVDKTHLFNKLEEIFNIVWCMNQRILEIFGSAKNEIAHGKEQRILSQWLLLQILGYNNSILKFISASESLQPLGDGHGTMVKDLLIRSLSYGEDEYIWKIPKYCSREEVFISKRKLLMTEVAIYVLGSYYKRNNLEKWEFFFLSDDNFVCLLATIKKRLGQNNHQGFVKRKVTQCKSLGIIPWKQNWDPDASGLQILRYNMDKELSKPITHWVKPSIRIQNLIEVELVYPKIEQELCLNLRNIDGRCFAWINSILAIVKDLWVWNNCDEFRDFFKKIEQNLASRNNYLSFKVPEKYLRHSRRLVGNLEKLSKLVFCLNKAFIKCFGSDVVERVLNTEEKNFSIWYTSKLINPQTNHTLIDVALNENLEEFNELSPLQHLLFVFLMNPNDNSLYKREFGGKLTEPMNTELLPFPSTYVAVNIVGAYYKTKNIKKWAILFNHDEKFLKFLARIDKKSLPMIKFTQGSMGNLALKTMDILPWIAAWNPSSKQKKYLRSLFGSIDK